MRVASAALACVALGLAGAGLAAADTLYVTSDLGPNEGTGVRGFTIREDGTLVPAAQPVTDIGEDAEGLAATPDARFLYVAEADRGRVHAFRIRADGALIPVDDSPFVTEGSGTRALAVTPDGQFLYVTHLLSAGVSGFRIAADGSLSAVPGSPFRTGAAPGALVASPDSRRLYVANFGSDNLSGFTIGADGALTPVVEEGRLPGGEYPSWKTGHQPVSIAISVPRRVPQVYVANYGSDTLSGYWMADNGELVPVPGSWFAAGEGSVNPSGLAVTYSWADATGRLYVADEGNGGVSVFRVGSIDPFSFLEPLRGSPFLPREPGATSIAVSPNWRWVYTATRTSGVSVFEIVNRNFPYGRLSEVERSPLPVPGARAFAAVPTPARCAGTRATLVTRDGAVFRATPGSDVIVGNAAANRIQARGGGDLMCAAGGADLLRAGSGDDRLHGRRGGDRLIGGHGDDRLSGGSGRDRLHGGSGEDGIAGGAGSDRIVSTDAHQDIVDCGAGHDRVTADRSDRLSRCERVRLRR